MLCEAPLWLVKAMCLVENAAPLPLLRSTCVFVLLEMTRCTPKPTLAPISSVQFPLGVVALIFHARAFLFLGVSCRSFVDFYLLCQPSPPPLTLPPSCSQPSFSLCSPRGHPLRPSRSSSARTNIFLQEHDPLEGASISYEDVDGREGKQWWQCVFCSPDVSSQPSCRCESHGSL